MFLVHIICAAAFCSRLVPPKLRHLVGLNHLLRVRMSMKTHFLLILKKQIYENIQWFMSVGTLPEFKSLLKPYHGYLQVGYLEIRQWFCFHLFVTWSLMSELIARRNISFRGPKVLFPFFKIVYHCTVPLFRVKSWNFTFYSCFRQ